MNPVTNIGIGATPPGSLSAPAEQIEEGSSFKNFLLDSIREVNSMQQEADQAVERLVSGGEDVTPAEVLTAVQKADIAFRMMMQIRNKMIQAYQEVQNIRI